MNEAPTPSPVVDLGAAGGAPAPKKKTRDKARRAWMSFLGRIVAQIVGAAVSIALAIMFLQTSQSSEVARARAAEAMSSTEAASMPRTPDSRITLAVLPLSNYSGDAQQDYFVDGMTEALIADLAQIKELRVVSRTSVMKYRDEKKSLPQIGRELGVDVVVEGSVARAGERVRITAQLIDASTDDHLWAATYDRTLHDVLSLQGQLAAEIAKGIKVAITPIHESRLAQRP